MSEKISVILPASRIPLGEEVTKLKGTKKYLLGDRLTVYQVNGEKAEIEASPGVRFLVQGTFANAIAADTPLVWKTDEQTLLYFLEGSGG